MLCLLNTQHSSPLCFFVDADCTGVAGFVGFVALYAAVVLVFVGAAVVSEAVALINSPSNCLRVADVVVSTSALLAAIICADAINSRSAADNRVGLYLYGVLVVVVVVVVVSVAAVVIVVALLPCSLLCFFALPSSTTFPSCISAHTLFRYLSLLSLAFETAASLLLELSSIEKDFWNPQLS